MWEEVRSGRYEGDAVGMHGEGPTLAVGARARVERTRNISFMFVTFEVSKLSGSLNFDAYCRVERRACRVRRGAS